MGMPMSLRGLSSLFEPDNGYNSEALISIKYMGYVRVSCRISLDI